MKNLKAIQISEHVYWVGAIDWSIRDFHGYATPRGSTYNAYLIMGADKTVLVDTVKKPFKNELLSRITSVTDPSNIDYIISNHAEPDHTGCLDEMISIVKPERIFASKMGVKALKQHFHWAHEITEVNTKETLDLGGLHLRFMETRMLHWPDSMFTYLEEDKVLFAQDAFGLHLATGERFVDQCDMEVVYEESEKYFANILLPYAPLITNLFNAIEGKLDISVIAQDHGPIWRQDLNKPIEWYKKWATQKPSYKAVIIFDTMWHATENMALTIAETLIEKGIEVKVMPLKGSHRSAVIKEILTAGAIIVGTPTLNNNIFPTIADTLTYVKGLKPKNKLGMVFGSYGWSGEAVKQAVDYLEACKVNVTDSLKVQYQPDIAALEECRLVAGKFADKLKEYVEKFD